jgi:hypothetical protein
MGTKLNICKSCYTILLGTFHVLSFLTGLICVIQLAQDMSLCRNLSQDPFKRSNNILNEKGTGITIANKLKDSL